MKLLCGLALLAVAPLACAFDVIDDFTTGPYSFTTSTVGTLFHAAQSGSMIGGHRVVTSILTQDPLVFPTYHVGIGGGFVVMDAGSEVQHVTQFEYGYSDYNIPANLGHDFLASGANAFHVAFDSNDLDLLWTVFVRSNTSNGGNWEQANLLVAGGRPTTAFDADIMFSAFPAINFHEVDQVIFAFSNLPSGDASFTSFGTTNVPGPGALVVAVVGGLGVLARRRKR